MTIQRPEQIRRAAQNTARHPRNTAPAVRQALPNTRQQSHVSDGYVAVLARLMRGAP